MVRPFNRAKRKLLPPTVDNGSPPRHPHRSKYRACDPHRVCPHVCRAVDSLERIGIDRGMSGAVPRATGKHRSHFPSCTSARRCWDTGIPMQHCIINFVRLLRRGYEGITHATAWATLLANGTATARRDSLPQLEASHTRIRGVETDISSVRHTSDPTTYCNVRPRRRSGQQIARRDSSREQRGRWRIQRT